MPITHVLNSCQRKRSGVPLVDHGSQAGLALFVYTKASMQ